MALEPAHIIAAIAILFGIIFHEILGQKIRLSMPRGKEERRLIEKNALLFALRTSVFGSLAVAICFMTPLFMGEAFAKDLKLAVFPLMIGITGVNIKVAFDVSKTWFYSGWQEGLWPAVSSGLLGLFITGILIPVPALLYILFQIG
ncbi:hypothetical protein [Pseudosulfitobacter pseudonitzschiae]|uniref:hypothetical protein n=1 Tax=Pseudosulfitobacter pseudonitzschiae TaxID=1402135 RepID=UPI003B816D75